MIPTLSTSANDVRCGNRLLDALPPHDRIDLLADLTLISMEAHRSTHAVGDVIDHVDFPIDAVLSVVATLEDGGSVEVGTVGNEGFLEYDAALGASRTQRSSFCQVRGTIGRMSAARFAARMTTSEAFARRMRLNVRAALFSAQQFAACNAKHSVTQRSARWLAMTCDRVGHSDFTLTHDFLAIMLGVRRASASDATEAIQRAGAIAYARGNVRVLDVERLRAMACECYGACATAFAESLRE